jgi:octaprenyl-diphosphate synthase
MLATHTTASAEADPAAPPLNRPPSWVQIVAPVEPFLRSVAHRLAAQIEEFEPEIVRHARYALDSQGKQLRPALVGLSAEAAGRLNDTHVTVAVIIEMVHLATLVHDDVMDAAEMRRRRPTLAVQCGASTSVLLGDCLFAHALVLAASFPTPDVCRAVASATRTVCTGETIQTERPSRFDLGREEYFRILRMKTGELFALSCELGARLTGAGVEEQRALRDYGMALGTAYQIFDDCVDLFGSESQAGKSLGTDLVGGKLTLPLIVAIERVGAARRPGLERLLARWQPDQLATLRSVLQETEALAESTGVIRGFCGAACEALEGLPPSAGRRALVAATEFLARQTDSLGAVSGG